MAGMIVAACDVASLTVYVAAYIDTLTARGELKATGLVIDGKTYKLADFKGKKAVVLAWFPKAYTSGCTIECKSLAENGDKIRKFNVAYFMASVDAVEDNKGFAEKEKADFPLLSDPTKATATAYGVLSPGGLARRWTFYIGKDGKILGIDKAVTPKSSAEDMVAKLGEYGVEAAK